MKELLDGRDQEALARELRRCAAAVFGGDTEFVGPREIIEAMLGVAARIGEEVTQRLDRVPEKQAANFHAAMGADRAPPVPATVPVAVTLAATAPAGLAMPAGTRLQATTDADPITFETLQGMTLLRGAVQRVCAADLEGDRIVIAPPSVAAPALPRPKPIRRVLASAAAAGATKLQIDPATGLAAGMVISFGDPALEADHEIVEVEGDLVTVEPSVATTVPQASEVREVTRFSPWQAGARNRQSHRLYLGHSTLLDLPSATTIFVSGVVSDQADIEWAWFGKLADSDPEPIWHAFADPHIDERDRWVLDKPKGRPEKTPVRGRQGLWLRATLDGGSDGSKTARSIRIAAGACEAAASSPAADSGADFEAVAVTTPVVRAKPFHPFGREPRIYDSFYVGCNEVFGKAGAKAWLAFTLGGAVLGPMAAVTGAASVQLFAVGTDGLLYRARLDGTAPRFETLALPTELEQIGFPSQAVVTARIVGGRIALAVADRGSVYTTVVDIDPGTAPGRPVWQRLAGDAASADLVASSIFIAGDGVGTVLALCGGRLLTWTQGSGGPQLKVDEHAIDLIPVQTFNGEMSVLVRTDVQGVHGAPGDWEVFVWVGSIVGATFLTTVPANSLPETMRAAWAQGNDIFVAGFATAPGPEAPLELVRLSSAGLEPAPDDPGTYEPRPIGLEPPYDAADLWPVLVLATPVPTRIAFHSGNALTVADEADIGASGNAARHFDSVSGWTVVQHPDRGIFYRRNYADPPSEAGKHAVAGAQVAGSYVLAANDHVLPGDPAWVAFVGATDGAAYQVIEHTVTHDRLLLPASSDAVPSPGPDTGDFPAGAALPLRAATGVQNSLTVGGTAITLATGNGYDPNATALQLLIESAEPRWWIWSLSRNAGQTDWTALGNFDPTPGAAPRVYTALETIPDPNGNPSPVLGPGNTRPYFAAPTGDVAKLRSAGPARDLFAGGTEIALDKAMQHGSDDIFPIRADLIENRAGDTASLWVALRSAAWSLLGPNQPANPELSWEYWNGSSWWALAAATLADSTADLLASGDITFAVPPDMAETDVGGRKNRWLRARLIGGDYGEARVTVISEVVNPTTTKQSVSRDLSAIRAPHVIDLKVTYCTTEALVPEIVLAADNLGVVDQTNANDAGLPVRFFLPVSAALDPQRQETAGDAAGTGECCERWEDGPATPATGPAATAPLPGRLILLALDQPPKGDVVSLYIDAEPTGGWAKLAARVFRAGAFAAVEIIEDATSGLNESGTITLRVAEAPDRTELFGLSAFWLALAPATAAAAASWSPRLRGIHLNGVMAASVETRRNEPIGSSSGAPDQRFSLVAPPVDPDSLDLWISEPLGTREADDLGAEKAIEGMPGPWVKWKRKPELPVGEAGVPERVFTLNALTGELRFGDGRNALIPPPGSALLARSYTHVVGEAANGVAAGAQLQPVSPVAGVDKVKALDLAGGGADAESIEQALARAPAKLRHGDRPVTLADVEEYVRSRLPRVAQAVAENRRGRARLVIAERGETIVPAPATLRGIQADIAGAAAYGIAVRLDVTGPRLLPVRVEIAVAPDRGVDAATTFGRVRAAVLGLFDHETGGHDGRGWPIGARPEPADIAAALTRAELAETATIHRIAIARAGNWGPLPDPLPIDVLACVSDADVIVEPAGETVA